MTVSGVYYKAMLFRQIPLLLLLVFVTACSQKSSTDAYQKTAYSTENLQKGRLTYKIPKSWQQVPVSNPMRLAQYEINSIDSSATLSIYTFPGHVGGVAANITRWQAQFKEGMDKRTAPVKQFNYGPLPVSIVKISGTYLEAMQPMNPASPKKAIPKQAMMAAIVELENKSWFFKLIGDASLVEEERSNFMQILRSLKLKQS